MSMLQRLQVDRSVVDGLAYNPYYMATHGHVSGGFIVDGENYIDLASNDYLGLSTDRRVLQGAQAAMEKHGVSLCGTPVATGSCSIYAELANRLARFVRVESSVLFPSCYQANACLFASIVGREDVVLIDHYAHASLGQGVRAAGCKIMPFKHNDCEHLERMLKNAAGYRERFVVTESVFSTEGAIAPFDEIVGLCRSFDAIPVIDDSHGIGVLGDNGRGILEHFGMEDFPGIYTASLGKALANSGGMIGGPRRFLDYLSYNMPGLIYSTALVPAQIGGVDAVLDIIECEIGSRRGRLLENKERISDALRANGFAVADGGAPIVSVKCGSMSDTIGLAKKFFEQRMITTPFVEPSVPPGKGVVRIIPGAGIGDDERDEVVDTIRSRIR